MGLTAEWPEFTAVFEGLVAGMSREQRLQLAESLHRASRGDPIASLDFMFPVGYATAGAVWRDAA